MSSRGMLSEWYTENSVDVLLDRYLCEGDLLEFDQGDEQHWAVYAGHTLLNGRKKPTVLHFCSDDCCNGSVPGDSVCKALMGSNPSAQDEWSVLEDSLIDMLGKNKVRISNQLDNEWEPYCGEVVVKRATEHLKVLRPMEKDYVVPASFQSCKHFALMCRYDDNFVNSVTEETEKKASQIKSGLAIAGASTVIAGMGYLLWSKCGKKKSKSEDDE